MLSVCKKLLLTAAILTLSSTLYAEKTATGRLAATAADDSPVDNKSTYHISDSIDLVSVSDVRYEKPRIVIKYIYPRFNNSNDSDVTTASTDPASEPAGSNDNIKIDAFNQLVTKAINEEIDYFKQKVADAQSHQATLDKSKIKNRLTIDYSSAIINLEEDPLVSIRFIIQGYVTGMNHPFRRYHVVNFDVNAGSEIQLSEIFKPDSNYIEVMTEYATREMDKVLHGKNIQSTFTADNFANWNINLNGLRITFDEATVAPAVYGTQSILIPYNTLKKMINPESSLGECLKHRSRCMRDHLLTGGFIDEAANTRHRGFDPILS